MRNQIYRVSKYQRRARNQQEQHARARDALLNFERNLLTAPRGFDGDE